MFKIIWRTFFGGIMIGALVSFLFFSCAGIVNYKEINNRPIIIENAIENVYNNNNFVFFEKNVLLDEEGQLCYMADGCERKFNSEFITLSSSSGGVLRSIDDKIYTLTVAHFCVEFPESVGDAYEEKEPLDELIIVKFMGRSYNAQIETVDVEKDLCIISFKHNLNSLSAIDKIKLAKKMPKIGESVYTISSPLGLNSTSFRLHFEGKYAGCDYATGCLYTIPATFGSSGSLVFNEKGRLISVIAISIVPFQEISGGASVDQIRSFLKKFKCSTGIKLY